LTCGSQGGNEGDVVVDDLGIRVDMTKIEATDKKEAAKHGRFKILSDFGNASDREVDLEGLNRAKLLRTAALLHCPKDVMGRVKIRLQGARAEVQRIANLGTAGVLAEIEKVEKNPERYSRTVLQKAADIHFRTALNINEAAYKEGLKSARLIDGVHSAGARAISLGFSGATLGLSHVIPGLNHLVGNAGAHLAGKLVTEVCHELPTSLMNPIITGNVRVDMTSKQLRKMKGGQIGMAKNIRDAVPMREVTQDIRRCTTTLQSSLQTYRALGADDEKTEALKDVVRKYIGLHKAAEDEYKSRLALNRALHYGKGYGTAVNAAAGVGGIVSVAVPGPGTVAGMSILGGCVVAHLVAGAADKTTEQSYNVHAAEKYGDYLTGEGYATFYKDRVPDQQHYQEQKFRTQYADAAQVAVKNVVHVYTEKLGKLMAQAEQMNDRLKKHGASGRPSSKHAALQARLTAKEKEIEALEHDARLFETFEADQWMKLKPDGLIAKCLDDPHYLEKKFNKYQSKERQLQVMQRFNNAWALGVSSGVMLPVAEALTQIDGLHVDGSSTEPLLPAPRTAALALAAGGTALNVGLTGNVRLDRKDAASRGFHSLRVPEKKSRRRDRVEQDKLDWVVKGPDGEALRRPDGKPLRDLRDTEAYDKLYHTRWQRTTRWTKTLWHSMGSSARGLYHFHKVKGARKEARGALLDALAELKLAAGPDAPASAGRQRNLTAIKETFLETAKATGCLDDLYDKPPSKSSSMNSSRSGMDIPVIKIQAPDEIATPKINLPPRRRDSRLQRLLTKRFHKPAKAAASSGSQTMIDLESDHAAVLATNARKRAGKKPVENSLSSTTNAAEQSAAKPPETLQNPGNMPQPPLPVTPLETELERRTPEKSPIKDLSDEDVWLIASKMADFYY
jgi:hypothetical protein